MIIARLDCLNGNCDRLTFSGAKFLSSLSFLLYNDSGYPHDGRADKNPYPHDRRADKDSYPPDSNN